MTTRSQLDIDVAARTDTGRQRRHNEDSYLVTALGPEGGEVAGRREVVSSDGPGWLFMVADGMGGAAAGEVASRMSVDSIRARFAENPPPDELSDEEAETLLKEVVVEVNGSVYERASSEFELRGMGATLTLAWIRGDLAHLVQVGDSRAYLLRDGALRRLTRDQSLVEHLVAAKKISPEEAAGHKHANVILQAIGVRPDLQPVTGTFSLRPGDRLLICSDGLTGPIDDDELAALLDAPRPPDDIADGLVELANARGGPDNITVLVLRLEEAGMGAGPTEKVDTSVLDALIDTAELPALSSDEVPRDS